MLPTQTTSPGLTPAVDPAPVSAADRVSQFTYLLFGLLEGVLGIRVLLKLLAADPQAGFTSLIYTLTAPFVALFQGVFATPQSRGNVLELSSLLAIVVYALLGYGLARLAQILGRARTTAVR
jgi:hypothetical protein